jgi:predicted nucleotidyltransferase
MPWAEVPTLAACEPPALPPGFSLYLFGSVLRLDSDVADIDILIVYPDGELDQAHTLAGTLRNSTSPRPLDVLAMSRSEEHETGFVLSESAVSLIC